MVMMNLHKDFNILLVRLGSLGDLLITVPSINLIRDNLPQSKLTLIANRAYGLFLKEAGLVDILIPLENRQALTIFDNKKKKGETDLRNIDLLIVWLNKEFPGSDELIPEILREKAQLIVGMNEKNFSLSKYFLIKTGEVLETIAGERIKILCEERKYARLTIKSEWIKEAERLFPGLFNHNFVVIHPGSGGERKRWKLDNFLKLVSFLASRKFGGIMITGPAEENYISILSGHKWPENWCWYHELPLRIISALLSRTSLYIGNDSGITHLAALCGCPGLALFRKENVSFWAPNSERIKILEATDINEIDVEFVWWEIQNILAIKRN